jgi:pilus assembly protein CpaF
MRVHIMRLMMDRVGFAEVARIVKVPDVEQARVELRPALEAVINADTTIDLGVRERERVISDVLDDVVGLGPLQSLLEDDEVTEIMVNGCTSTFIERGGVLSPIGRPFESDEQIRILIDRIISPLGRRVDERSPMVNARLPNGYRVNAVIPPVAIDGPTLTIRKFSDRISSLEHLVRLGSLPAWYAQMLSFAVRLREDLAVVGGTGSGKTTLLNALSCEIPHGERIVTIEDSAELKFTHHPHVVRLEAREASIEGEGAVTIHDLLVNALRMRPDRIVVGEVRNREAIDMLEAMSTGHDGSLTTLHAGSAEEAVVRLTLLARYGIDLASSLIEEQIAMALDGIVMSVRTPSGKRYVSSYTGVSRAPGGGVELTEYVRGGAVAHTWELIREPPFIGEALRTGALEQEEVDRWRSSCQRASECSRQSA